MNETKRKLLIIEDDPGNLKLEKDLLILGGFEIITADNAENGIILALQKQPDAIILDYQLPGMNGIDAAKILAENEKTSHIPIVFVTASVTKEIIIKINVLDWKVITKPINTRTFSEEIRSVLK
ncbi:MAG TPA: response regulator [bacterium]|nr:response regulator [bacterium]